MVKPQPIKHLWVGRLDVFFSFFLFYLFYKKILMQKLKNYTSKMKHMDRYIENEKNNVDK